MPVTVYTGVTQLRGVSSYAATSTGTAPTITSDGGGSTAAVSVNTGDTDVTTVTATGTAPVTFYIQGGADASLFQIDAATGGLSFVDASVDGAYVVIVGATNLAGADTQTITATVSSGSYHADAVHFNGSSLLSSSALTGVTPFATLTFSMWVNMHQAGGSGFFTQLSNDNFLFKVEAANWGEADTDANINMKIYDGLSYTKSFEFSFNDTNPNPLFALNVWRHVFVSLNTNHSAGQKIGNIWIDGVQRATTVTGDASSAFSCDLGGEGGAIPDFGDDQPPACDIADAWIGLGQYVADPTDKFISAGKPIDLGANGSTPTGTSPTIFLSGNASAFGTNQGTGGAFTLTGSLTNASSSPSD